jgi:hypothetical protein
VLEDKTVIAYFQIPFHHFYSDGPQGPLQVRTVRRPIAVQTWYTLKIGTGYYSDAKLFGDLFENMRNAASYRNFNILSRILVTWLIINRFWIG